MKCERWRLFETQIPSGNDKAKGNGEESACEVELGDLEIGRGVG
jgi:hypothetical protein